MPCKTTTTTTITLSLRNRMGITQKVAILNTRALVFSRVDTRFFEADGVYKVIFEVGRVSPIDGRMAWKEC